MKVERESGGAVVPIDGLPMFQNIAATSAGLEGLRTLGAVASSQAPTRNLAEELYRQHGPFDFEKNESRNQVCLS